MFDPLRNDPRFQKLISRTYVEMIAFRLCSWQREIFEVLGSEPSLNNSLPGQQAYASSARDF